MILTEEELKALIVIITMENKEITEELFEKYEDNKQITSYLVSKANTELLNSLLWDLYGNPFRTQVILTRYMLTGEENIKTRDYAEFAMKYNKQPLLRYILDGINTLEIKELLNIALELKSKDSVVTILKKDKSLIYDIPSEHHELLNGTEFENKMYDSTSSDMKNATTKYRFDNWTNKRALALSLQSGDKSLDTIRDYIIKYGIEEYKRPILRENEEKRHLNNPMVKIREDLNGDDITQYGDLTSISLTEDGRFIYWFSVSAFDNLLETKKNPYTGVALTTSFLNEVKRKLDTLRSMKVDVKEIYPLDEVLSILTDPSRTAPGSIEEKKKVSVADELASYLQRDYLITAEDYLNKVDNSTLRDLVRSVENTLAVRFPITPSKREDVYTMLVNYIKGGRRELMPGRVAAVYAALSDYLRNVGLMT